MIDQDIAITAVPIDAGRCKFVADRPIDDGRWSYFADIEKAQGSPLAERLFALAGVSGVLIAHDKVTIAKVPDKGWPVVGLALRTVRLAIGGTSAGGDSWPALGKRVGSAIRAHLLSGEPAVREGYHLSMPSSIELRTRVQKVLDEDVNPVVAGHGGGVTLIDVNENVVYVRMVGGCQGCGLADVTLKNAVEAAIRDAVPEIGEILDLTDHSAGRNPFFKRAVK